MNFGLSAETIVAAVGALLALLSIIFVLRKRIPKRMQTDKLKREWRSIQQMLPDKDNWPVAITKADSLLDKTMLRRRKSGENMGERLVTCQNEFTNNDAVWRAHKLANKIREQDSFLDIDLSEKDVKQSLMALGQAMRDLGAF